MTTTIIDEAGCRIVLFPNLLGADAPSWAEIESWPWARDRAAGRVARRETCAFAVDTTLRYRYSGTNRAPVAFPESIAWMLAAIPGTGASYNFCLANLYRDHNAALGWHADDERDLVEGAPIATVSIGATRMLGLRRIADLWQTSVELRSGDALVMLGETQRRWQHCVCRGVAGSGPRASLTFRAVRGNG